MGLSGAVRGAGGGAGGGGSESSPWQPAMSPLPSSYSSMYMFTHQSQRGLESSSPPTGRTGFSLVGISALECRGRGKRGRWGVQVCLESANGAGQCCDGEIEAAGLK